MLSLKLKFYSSDSLRYLVQVSILIVEFVQLVSFPYRDLMRYPEFQKSLVNLKYTGYYGGQNTAIVTLGNFVNTISLGVPNLKNVLFNIQFVIAWWCSLVGFLLFISGVLITRYLNASFFLKRPNLRRIAKKAVFGSWIVMFQPLTSIFYLILLGAFIIPLGCLFSNSDPLWPPQTSSNPAQYYINQQNAVNERISQCSPVLNNPSVQIWSALLGYLMGYATLTIFKISDDPKPTNGIISYTRQSEGIYSFVPSPFLIILIPVVNKNLSLVLLLIYSLLPDSKSSMERGVLAILVLCFMVLFQIFIGSSYIRSINFVRTLSFLFVLWTSMVVTYFTSPSQVKFYANDINVTVDYKPWVVIMKTVLFGWLVLFKIYTLSYFAVIRKIERITTQPRQGIRYQKDDQIGLDEDSKFDKAVDTVITYPFEKIRNMSRSSLGNIFSNSDDNDKTSNSTDVSGPCSTAQDSISRINDSILDFDKNEFPSSESSNKVKLVGPRAMPSYVKADNEFRPEVPKRNRI
jgi:hypothetical protein